MTRGFIKVACVVRQKYGEDDFFPLFVNESSICSIFKQSDNLDTVISTADGHTHHVVETPEEIMEMIGGGK